MGALFVGTVGSGHLVVRVRCTCRKSPATRLRKQRPSWQVGRPRPKRKRGSGYKDAVSVTVWRWRLTAGVAGDAAASAPGHRRRRAVTQRTILRVGHVRMLVLSSPEAAREVMKTHDAVFASRPLTPTMDIITYGGKGVALSPYGQRWKELRKICAIELLSPRSVRSFRRVREAEAARLVRAVAASPTWPLVNVSEHVAAMMNDIIMMTAVGGRCPRQEEYLEELGKVAKLLAGFNLVDLFPESRLVRALTGGSLRAAQAAHEKIHSIMDAMVQDHLKAMERREEVADGVVVDGDGDGEAPREREKTSLASY